MIYERIQDVGNGCRLCVFGDWNFMCSFTKNSEWSLYPPASSFMLPSARCPSLNKWGRIATWKLKMLIVESVIETKPLLFYRMTNCNDVKPQWLNEPGSPMYTEDHQSITYKNACGFTIVLTRLRDKGMVKIITDTSCRITSDEWWSRFHADSNYFEQ